MTDTHRNRRQFLLSALGAAAAAALPGTPLRAASRKNPKLWPGGLVPIHMESAVTHSQMPVIMAAITELNQKTNAFLRLTPSGLLTAPGQSYVTFIDDGTGNFTRIGAPSSGSRDVHINKNVRSLHELGHVLGLIHEQSRSDRDQFIRFLDPALAASTDGDWARVDDSENYGIPYNLGSFMQYWDTAGSSSGKRTMEYIPDPSRRWDTPEWLNADAVRAVNALYPRRCADKPAFATVEGIGRDCVLHCAQAAGYLDAGPDHIRLSKHDDGQTNPFLRWQPVRPDSRGYLLHNAHADRYLDAGPDHTRDGSHGDSARNPFLRWQFERIGDYYVLYNPHTASYLDGGPNHARKKQGEESYSNRYLRWTLDFARS
ncbi:M12 family metallopeptidase [Mangrovicoccus sp. HB161399]|uniref:M12 family metallopeptidase n=1 Tax=Mangrovicoccus sp. HB161399 TaxID=2720392 RepID=UPI001552B920|nr:M12 family metallopeptidase [Mangrovicoccus sp. HB161399]